MNTARAQNLLGALAVALTDALQRVTALQAGHGAAAPAALVGIGTYPGQTIDQLSTTLQLSHSGTVRLIDRLAHDGLVERRAGSDGRSVALYLTERGEQTTQALLAERQRVLGRALQALSDAEQDELTRLIEKVFAAIVEGRQHADHICRLCDEAVCPQETCPVECAVQG
jgi:MarR family transcriptional regulator, negative regulator of the multidrug operon emrRAB